MKKFLLLVIMLFVIGGLSVPNADAFCTWSSYIEGNSVVYKVQSGSGWRLVTIVTRWADYDANINRDSVRGIVFRDDSSFNCRGNGSGRCSDRIVLGLPAKSGASYAVQMVVTCGYQRSEKRVLKITW